MLPNIPNSLLYLFLLTTILCLYLVFKIIKSSQVSQKYAVYICLAFVLWLGVQAVLTLNGIYTSSPNSFPPKITIMGIFPMFILILLLFTFSKTRKVIDTFSLESLAYLNVVRIPVEIALFWLFLNKAIPEIMTFEGRNFDIIAGLSAPILVYFYKKGLNPKLFITWHIISLMLLLNIVFIAIFSGASPFQKFGFEQPNIAIVNFPFSWLATFIVPMVLFGHLASIRILSKSK